MSDKPKPAPKKERQPWRLRAALWGCQGLLTAALAGLIVHFSIRDHWAPVAPLYYLVPPGAALLLAMPCFVLALRSRRTWLLGISLITIGGGAFGWWRWDYRGAEPARALQTTSEGTRVIAWNLADAFWGVETVGAGVEQLGPDVAVLFEAPSHAESREIFGRLFPGCVVAPFSEDGLVVVRGSISDVSKRTVGGGTVSLFEVDVEMGSLSLAIVDLSPTSLSTRATDLYAAAESIERWRGKEPLILVASVHMPRNSVRLERHFGGLGLRETFLAGGSGLGTGWPAWLPVYDGEQFWISDELRIERSAAEWSIRSDHLPWVLEVDTE